MLSYSSIFQRWDSEDALLDFPFTFQTLKTRPIWKIHLFVTRMDLSYLHWILQQPASYPDVTLFSIMRDSMESRILPDMRHQVLFTRSCVRYRYTVNNQCVLFIFTCLFYNRNIKKYLTKSFNFLSEHGFLTMK